MMNMKRIGLTLLLALTLILAACGNKDSDQKETSNQTTQKRVMGEGNNTQEVENDQSDDQSSETSSNEASSDQQTSSDADDDEGGEIDVSLFDRALLESIKFNLPDTYMKVSEEHMGDEKRLITTYQKGYSTRVETTVDGVTEVEIYNEKEGITYEYTLGETTGYMMRDTADDIAYLNEDKAMVGKSLMSIFEGEDYLDLVIKASRDKFLGRKVILIEMSEANPEAGAYPSVIKMWFDEKYTVDLKSIMDFSEDWKNTAEATEIEFNLKLNDDLFEAPQGVSFNE